MLPPGLYEQLINHNLRQELDTVPAERKSVMPVDPAEATEVLSRYIAEAAKRALSGMAEGRGDVADQVALANRLIGLLPEMACQSVDGRAEQLMALLGHKAQGSHVLLFVREFKNDACGAAPYTFLGTADYVSHTGSRPMNIVWRLHQEIPAKFLRKTQQVVG